MRADARVGKWIQEEPPTFSPADLARLVKPNEEMQDRELKRGVLGVAGKFGLLDPFDARRDTLGQWYRTAIEARTLLSLAKHLKRRPNTIENIKQQLEESWGLERVRSRWRPVKPHAGAASDSLAYITLGDVGDESDDPLEVVRGRVLTVLEGRFSKAVRDRVTFEGGLIYARVGIYPWLMYELTLVYRSGKQMRTCRTCGTAFIPSHGRQTKYCSSNCGKNFWKSR